MKGMTWLPVVALVTTGLIDLPGAAAQSGQPALPETQRVQVVSPGKDSPVVPVLSRDGRDLFYIKELNTGGDEISQAVFHFRLENGELRLQKVVAVETQFDDLQVRVEATEP